MLVCMRLLREPHQYLGGIASSSPYIPAYLKGNLQCQEPMAVNNIRRRIPSSPEDWTVT